MKEDDGREDDGEILKGTAVFNSILAAVLWVCLVLAVGSAVLLSLG